MIKSGIADIVFTGVFWEDIGEIKVSIQALGNALTLWKSLEGWRKTERHSDHSFIQLPLSTSAGQPSTDSFELHLRKINTYFSQHF